MEKLHVTNVNGVPIKVDFVPKGNYRVRPAYPMKPKSIAIHNTGNKDAGADALMHAKYLKNNAKKKEENTRYAAWHFTVDAERIVQHLPLDESGWHTGDGTGSTSGNRTAIGVEIAEPSDGNYAKAEENAVHLVVALMKETGLGIGVVKPHQAYSGKYCPHIILSRAGGFSTFTTAVLKAKAGNKVVVKDDGVHASFNDKDVDRVDDSYVGRRVESIYKGKEGLNFYNKPSFDADPIGVLQYGYGFPTIVEKVNGGTMYKVKNSKGAIFYVTASSKYVKLEGEAKAPVDSGRKTVNGIEVKGYVKVDKLNNFTYIYSSNSGNSPTLGKAMKGTVYPIAGSVSGWYEVIYNGKRAYIRAKYCSRA